MAQVEVDEVFRLCQKVLEWFNEENATRRTVCNEATKVSSDYAMPCRSFLSIELGVCLAQPLVALT